MTAITLINNDLKLELINDFIKYIDRCEKTARGYITNLRQFVTYLSFKSIARPERQDVINYRDYLINEHDAIKLTSTGWIYRIDNTGEHIKIKCKASTVKQYLQAVSKFFKWTAVNGYYPNIAEGIHAPKVKNDIHKKESLTPEEVLTIEKSILSQSEIKKTAARVAEKDSEGKFDRATEQGKRLYAMYLLAVNCGLRTCEISRANIKDIEIKNGVAYLYIFGKGRSEADQKKTLAPEVKEAIDDYLHIRADGAKGPLFVATGNRSRGKRLATTTISTMLKRAMQAAGYNSERITAHSLRHTAGTNVQELTNNIYLTQQYMRHQNPATTEIYLHNNTEKQETDIANRLYNLYHNKKENNSLEALIARMTEEQKRQLEGIAAAICH